MLIISFLASSLGPAVLILIWLTITLVNVFWIVELIDAFRREFIPSNVKIVWILVIFFLHFVGALAYYCVGKNQGTLPGAQIS